MVKAAVMKPTKRSRAHGTVALIFIGGQRQRSKVNGYMPAYMSHVSVHALEVHAFSACDKYYVTHSQLSFSIWRFQLQIRATKEMLYLVCKAVHIHVINNYWIYVDLSLLRNMQ